MFKSMVGLYVLIISFVVLANDSSATSSIPIIAVDDFGEEKIKFLNKEKYVKYMSLLLDEVQTSTLSSLSSHKSMATKWRLDSVTVGLGFSGEINFGPFGLGTGIRQRFIRPKIALACPRGRLVKTTSF